MLQGMKKEIIIVVLMFLIDSYNQINIIIKIVIFLYLLSFLA